MQPRKDWAGMLTRAAFVIIIFGFEAAIADDKTLQGSIFYKERIALPPNAVIEVELVEISPGGAGASLAAVQMRPNMQPPVPFELTYDGAAIDGAKTYAVRAKISAAGQVLFASQTPQPAFGDAASGGLMVLVQSATPKNEESLTAVLINDGSTWLAEDIGGGGVIDRAQSTLSIDASGGATGSGGCNRYRSNAAIQGGEISLGPPAATRMLCPPAVMDQEGKFFAALSRAKSYKIDGPHLKLYGEDGAALVRFTKL